MNKPWSELPCSIPDYANLTIGEYASLIKSCVAENKFNLAAEYNIIYKMELCMDKN